MFRCGLCGEVTPPKTREKKIPLETREVVYPPVVRGNEGYAPEGWETVKEVSVCPACAKHPPEPKVVEKKTIEEQNENREDSKKVIGRRSSFSRS